MLYNMICAEMYKQNSIAKQKLWVQLGILTRNTIFILLDSGGRLNKKDGLTRCGDSHVKDKTS